MNTQQSLGNDQYPKSITESNNVLSNHKFDVTASNKATGKKNNGSDANKSKDKKDDETKEDEEVNLSFAQMEGK